MAHYDFKIYYHFYEYDVNHDLWSYEYLFYYNY